MARELLARVIGSSVQSGRHLPSCYRNIMTDDRSRPRDPPVDAAILRLKPQCTSVGSKHKLGNELGSQAFFGTLKLDRVMIMRGFVIGALAVAVAVLGYLYWDSQHNTIVKLPGVEIKKN